jgi:hypothetical protein
MREQGSASRHRGSLGFTSVRRLARGAIDPIDQLLGAVPGG